ncbi:protector from prophage-induced early lysis [Serratia phage PS2]|uniref:Protector from prophage-induced early lysis n=1 Tax=Serratia phage PS2 TaxID=1481112 RepID=A0A023W5I0_9CAUD|nr:RIIA lysis inhibitor [Serratia phage PS2]AHY25525.1 protector from prophage-induced early lysis [Serratia phage PS2]
MKMHDISEPTLGNAGDLATKFKMRASAKAFKVLSSSIYKYKIRAIYRELTTNCTDAHILAGHTRKFDVKLPTDLDLRFIVRDYGPGMSDDQIMHMYTTYFESTKEDSNDFTGALGLGSKSPFCYTDTFSVISRFGGERRLYTAFISGGEPEILPAGCWEMEEDEETGLEIIVPTKAEDTAEWHRECLRISRPFHDIQPNITPSKQIDFLPEEDEFILEDSPFESVGHYAVMGRIVYPIPSEVLNGTWSGTLNKRVFLRFDLGMLDISASREELSLDPITRANINARLKERDDRLTKELLEQVEQCKCPRDYLKLYGDLSSASQNWFQNNTTYRGKTVTQWRRELSELADSIEGLSGYALEAYASRLTRKEYQESRSNGRNIRRSAALGPNNQFEIVIVREDIKGQRGKAVRALASMHSGLYCITFETHDGINPSWVELSERRITKLKELFEGRFFEYSYSDEVIQNRIKDMKVKRESSGEAHPKSANCIHYDGTDATLMYLTSNEARELDGYVVYKYRDDICTWTGESTGLTEGALIKSAKDFGICTDFYIVRPSILKKVKESPDAIDLIYEINEKVKELVPEIPVDQYGFTRSHTLYDRATRNGKLLQKLADEFIRPKSKVHPDWTKINEWVKSQMHKINCGLDVSWFKKFDENQNEMNDQFTECIADFKERNPLIYDYITDNYYFDNQKVLQNILDLAK